MKTLLMAGTLLLTATLANAETECAPLVQITDVLTERFGEVPRTVALGGGSVVTQYANEETGTWTLLVISPSGIACVVASGESWSHIAPNLLGTICRKAVKSKKVALDSEDPNWSWRNVSSFLLW